MNDFEKLKELILSYAFEDGNTYWCDRVEVFGDIKPEDKDLYNSELGAKGYSLKLRDAEDNTYHIMTSEKLDDAIKWFFTSDCLKDLEACADMVDFFAGDQIVQHAIFGEVVYG